MPDQQIIVGPDGEIQQRVTELDIARLHVHEYKGWLNNTGNWTEVDLFARPSLRVAGYASRVRVVVDSPGIRS